MGRWREWGPQRSLLHPWAPEKAIPEPCAGEGLSWICDICCGASGVLPTALGFIYR